jgi:hypothetical protein
MRNEVEQHESDDHDAHSDQDFQPCFHGTERSQGRGASVAVWEIGFEGETYEWDDESLMLSEARELKKWLKVAPPAWLTMLGEDDPEAATALICLLRRRAGQPDLRFADVDGDLKTLTFTLREGEDEDQETPDPTPDVT